MFLRVYESMKTLIRKVASVALSPSSPEKTVRLILGVQTTTSLVTAFAISRLDYCNSYWQGCRSRALRYRNVHRPDCCRKNDLWYRFARSRDTELQWLPEEQPIIFKLCTLMRLVRTGRRPSYLCDLVTLTSDIWHLVLDSVL
jgi:hypothetical protein